MYHSQTNGLVEHFNATLTHMLPKYVNENATNCPLWLPFVVHGEGSVGFFPFEVLYGRHPWGMLDVLWEEM